MSDKLPSPFPAHWLMDGRLVNTPVLQSLQLQPEQHRGARKGGTSDCKISVVRPIIVSHDARRSLFIIVACDHDNMHSIWEVHSCPV